MKRILLALLILMFALSALTAGSAAIIASGTEYETIRELTIDLYTKFENEKGNDVTLLYDYHIPKGTTSLYIIAHGWANEDKNSIGFVYADKDGIDHYMNYADYLPYLEKHTDIETLVVNACLGGAAVREAEKLKVSFDVYASCSEDEYEYGIMNRPLFYATVYTTGNIPQAIYTLNKYSHPISYISPRNRANADETKPPYLQ